MNKDRQENDALIMFIVVCLGISLVWLNVGVL